jgi:hypothetical protein
MHIYYTCCVLNVVFLVFLREEKYLYNQREYGQQHVLQLYSNVMGMRLPTMNRHSFSFHFEMISTKETS